MLLRQCLRGAGAGRIRYSFPSPASADAVFLAIDIPAVGLLVHHVHSWLTRSLIGPQSHFGDKLLGIRVVYPPNGTAVRMFSDCSPKGVEYGIPLHLFRLHEFGKSIITSISGTISVKHTFTSIFRGKELFFLCSWLATGRELLISGLGCRTFRWPLLSGCLNVANEKKPH